MKLSTVLASVNNNPNYYMFIPKQIKFWNRFDVKFIAIFIGEKIPDEISMYQNNIVLWNKNLNMNTAFVGQNLRIFYTALLNLPDDELVMITDMDMLPTSSSFYKNDLENFTHEDFIYYRHIDGNQIYMCYNAAHPKTWKKIFQIENENDIETKINDIYDINYNGIPGSTGWFDDQKLLFTYLINYPNLKVLNRPLRRLEVSEYHRLIINGKNNFLINYDDVHFHRNYQNNEYLINHAENQLQYTN